MKSEVLAMITVHQLQCRDMTLISYVENINFFFFP